MVFDFPDLADRIGEFDDLRRGVAAGEDEVESGRPGLDDVDDLGKGDQFEVDGDVDLIQDDHVVVAGGDGLPGQIETLPCEFDVRWRGMVTHDETIEAGEMNGEVREAALGGEELPVFASLHKLDDADPEALSDGAQGLAEGGRRFPLAVSGVDLDETFAVLLQNGLPCIRGWFHLRHLFLWSPIFPASTR